MLNIANAEDGTIIVEPGENDLSTVAEVYGLFNEVGSCAFATLDGKGGVESRIAHFFAGDEDGLYLRTMTVKPFYRQLKKGGKLAVSGEVTTSTIRHDENNLPIFDPGYMMRVSGDVRELSLEEVNAKAQHNDDFDIAVFDIKKYPETRVFVLYRFHGEIYAYDYEMHNRDHKLLRERFAFGGDTVEAPGLHINDDCTGCGACFENCTFKAIVPGEPYTINGERCDECGTCFHVCPANAVVSKGL